MSRILYFDGIGGASGDMILSVLFGLGVGREALQQALRRLIPDPFEIEFREITDRGIAGFQTTVRMDHDHEEHHHEHRGLNEIRCLLKSASLPEAVSRLSLQVFERLAAAEASVHGTTPERVHFHEVGAVDSLVDIIGACWGLRELNVDEVVVGPLPMGQGTIRCAHGLLPNPAPATVELLKTMTVVSTDEPFELVTPTGAALLSAWKTRDQSPSGARIIRAAYGYGHHELQSRPNVLRAILMETAAQSATQDECLVLECNLDDTAPELLGSLARRLMEAGALDVFLTPVQMKKQRPGTLFTALCREAQRDELLDLIFTESTTFGVREYTAKRTVLERRWQEVQTPYGMVRVKIGKWKGKDVTRSPEHDDCVKRAESADVPVRVVYEAAMRALWAGGNEQLFSGGSAP